MPTLVQGRGLRGAISEGLDTYVNVQGADFVKTLFSAVTEIIEPFDGLRLALEAALADYLDDPLHQNVDEVVYQRVERAQRASQSEWTPSTEGGSDAPFSRPVYGI
jgi:hypothetical protein